MARTSTASLMPLLACAALAMASACADTRSSSSPPERGDGDVPSVTVDEAMRQWRAQGGRAGTARTDGLPPRYLDGPAGRPGLSGGGTSGGSGGYQGAAPGLPSIPMRPDATTIPLPGRTTFPLPGGTTIPTPIDPQSPNPATVTVPTPSR